MKKKRIKLNKVEHVIEILEEDSLETLLAKYLVQDILHCFNVGFEIEQINRYKNLHKVKTISKNEKRNIAFNSLSDKELQQLEDNPNQFEEIIEGKMSLEEKIIQNTKVNESLRTHDGKDLER